MYYFISQHIKEAEQCGGKYSGLEEILDSSTDMPLDD